MTDIREQEMQNRIDSLTLEKENLRYEINCLKEQIAQLKKLAFGSRTEKTKKILGEVEEINLFDEVEVEAKGSAPEPVIEVPAHQRRKKQKGHLEQILKDVPHEERVITLPEDERICKRCGTQLISMGRKKIRTEVQFIPATVKVIDFYRESFQCLECRKKKSIFPLKNRRCRSRCWQSPSSCRPVWHMLLHRNTSFPCPFTGRNRNGNPLA